MTTEMTMMRGKMLGGIQRSKITHDNSRTKEEAKQHNNQIVHERGSRL